MKILFLGSGAFGLPTLEALFRDDRHEVLAVISQPDRPAGRHKKPTPTPIAQWALRNGPTVLRSADVNDDDFVRRIADRGAEAAVVIAFGQKLGEPLIAAMGDLAVNLHASLLPKYRGAAPINHAIIEGETVTGVSVIELAQRMDAGRVYATARLDIDPNETAGELHDRLARLGPSAIAGVLEGHAAGTLRPIPQDESVATRAPKLSKADGTVDFENPSAAVVRRIHGLTPWPGCRVLWRRRAAPDDPQTLIIHRARGATTNGSAAAGRVLPDDLVAVADGAIELLEVQVPGRPVMTFKSFLNGHPMEAGDALMPLPSQGDAK